MNPRMNETAERIRRWVLSGLLIFVAGVVSGLVLAFYLDLDRPAEPALASVAAPAPIAPIAPNPAPEVPEPPAVTEEAPSPALLPDFPADAPVPKPEPATVPAPTETSPTAPPAATPPVMPDEPPVHAAGSSLLIPVEGVKAKQLRDHFTDKRGGGRTHEAIDIMAPEGTKVFAVDDGRIAKLFDSDNGGLTIYHFDPTEKLGYYYAHLDDYAENLKEGQKVKRGDVIGYVGSSGNASSSAPHLHFAIFVLGPEKRWWEGTAINPYPLFTGGEQETIDAPEAPAGKTAGKEKPR